MIEEELIELDKLIASLKRTKRLATDYKKKLDKRAGMDWTTNSQNQIDKANVNTNWAAMEYDKAKTDFARAYEQSPVKTGTEEKEYHPSGFHHYKH